jgi:hypothetical protein
MMDTCRLMELASRVYDISQDFLIDDRLNLDGVELEAAAYALRQAAYDKDGFEAAQFEEELDWEDKDEPENS